MPRYYSSDDGWDSESSLSDQSEYTYYERSDDMQPYASSYQRRQYTQKPKRKMSKKVFVPQKRSFQVPESGQQAGVYVLRNTETNVCYVGKSDNIPVRINQHMQGNRGLDREGAITFGSTDDLESWERNEVLTRMYRSGMDSVRGWRYTRKGPLSMEEKISARNDIMEKFDLCRRCGHNNHFVDKCFARTPAFWCKDIPMQ
jgi:hypothetical protein